MCFIFRTQKLTLLAFIVMLSNYSGLHAESDTVIKLELLIALTTFGHDTVFRQFNYNRNGFLNTVEDSPRTDYRVTYHAEYDSVGRIRKLSEFRSELLYSIDYSWESGNRIKFTKQNAGSPEKEEGAIQYYGRLRGVDLPENNPLAPENFLIVKADSTQYLDAAGKVITTWYWDYDPLDRNIRWNSSTLDNTVPWVEEYTYGEMNGFPARYPALAGDIIVFIYDKRTGLSGYEKISSGNKTYRKEMLSNGRFMLNGRKVSLKTGYPERGQKSPFMVIIDAQKDGKARMVLPKGK